MLRYCFFLTMLCLPLLLFAQLAVSNSVSVRSPRIMLNDDTDAPPVAVLGSDDVLHFSFDEMSHTYRRYTCRVTHCNALFEPSGLSEIDYIGGFNNFQVEEWENSVNTTVLYTHYEFTVPNENVALLLSGNYILEVFDDEDDSVPVLVYRFSVVEPRVAVSAWVSGDTDTSFNSGEQQLSFVVNYSRCGVSSPASEIIPVVYQNRRPESTVSSLLPTSVMGNEALYEHNEKLIFPAGNEYRRFELTDPATPGMGVEEVVYDNGEYHALLYVDKPHLSHSNYRDENGRYYINTLEGYGTPIEADYVNVHFALATPFREGGTYYLQGDFTGSFSSENALDYDAEGGYYFTSRLLKLGLYNYRYLWVPYNSAFISSVAEGDFYETENEYLIYIYHREFGARYDKLVGVHSVSSSMEQ